MGSPTLHGFPAIGTPTGAQPPPKLLRVITRCATRPEFLATFGRFVDETSIFVATHQPRPCGVTLPFAIALEDGETMLRGEAEVVESRTEADATHRRPGMRLRILQLDGASRATHAELLSGKRAGTAPPPIPSDASAGPEKSEKSERGTPPPETRAPGSSYIVPANPFTELPDEALAYFIECTLYEEATMQPEARDPIGPSGPVASSSSEPLAPVPPAPVVEATMEIEPLPVPRRSYASALIAMIGAAIGLGGGFITWGLRSDDGSAAVAPAATPATAKPAPAPPPLVPAAPPEEPKPRVAVQVPVPVPVPMPAAVAPAAAATAPQPRREQAKPSSPDVGPGTGAPGCRAAIVTEPPDAAVRIDGALVGRTPLADLPVACGEHVVVVEHPRYERVERHLSVADGSDGRVELRLVRPLGVLELHSSPPGAAFTVNGAKAGHSPTTAHVQAFTFVKVKATLEGYGSWNQRVYVLGSRMTLTAPLEPGRRAIKSQAKPQL